MGSPLHEIHAARVAEGRLRDDAAQRAALGVLERVRADMAARPAPPAGLLARLRRKPPDPVRGAYLWGGVGRGKSMLMDLFFEAVPGPRKRRVHFHAFMQEIHAGLNQARAAGARDAIRPVAEDIVAGIDLLCFDEMQITDIADAMIVGRLFQLLFEAGVVVVTTSNRVPEDLYKDGLNRPLFEPFIALIRDRMEVWELVSETDYRLNRLSGSRVWFAPDDHAARMAIEALWTDLSGGDAPPLHLRVGSRTVTLPACRNGVARAGFFELCGRPLGPADYLAIAAAVRVLVLTDIPALSRHNFNEARRFVTLIDTLYEARVRLIASAAAQPDYLYLEGEGSFEFARTASRLSEMMSEDWARPPAG